MDDQKVDAFPVEGEADFRFRGQDDAAVRAADVSILHVGSDVASGKAVHSFCVELGCPGCPSEMARYSAPVIMASFRTEADLVGARYDQQCFLFSLLGREPQYAPQQQGAVQPPDEVGLIVWATSRAYGTFGVDPARVFRPERGEIGIGVFVQQALYASARVREYEITDSLGRTFRWRWR